MSGMTGSSAADNGVASQHLVDAVHLAVSQLHQDPGESGEPAAKRPHLDDGVGEVNMDQSIKQILFNINKAICLRLDGIESKLETVSSRTRYLEDKVEQVVSSLKQNGNLVVHSGTSGRGGYKRSSAVIVGLPQDRSTTNCGNTSDDSQSGMSGLDPSFQSLGPNVQLITLNTEEDFPNGTWVGDENNPEMRVRVPITPSDLLHVHSNCRTPEKMALALLDYLFDRETQATSNLSGLGKHGKRQLDPLMIYGIRCHLIHRFGITEQDWHRIKQNIDSKCRTAFRRKQGEVDLQQMQGAEILQTAGGEIQVLHATPEQVAQLQQAHQIQILQGDGQVMDGASSVQQIHSGEGGQEGIHLAVSMAQQDGMHVVTTETGETIHINSQQMEDGTHINAMVEDGTLQTEDGTLHITTQDEDGTLHIQAEDGTMREVKVQND